MTNSTTTFTVEQADRIMQLMIDGLSKTDAIAAMESEEKSNLDALDELFSEDYVCDYVALKDNTQASLDALQACVAYWEAELATWEVKEYAKTKDGVLVGDDVGGNFYSYTSLNYKRKNRRVYTAKVGRYVAEKAVEMFNLYGQSFVNKAFNVKYNVASKHFTDVQDLISEIVAATKK